MELKGFRGISMRQAGINNALHTFSIKAGKAGPHGKSYECVI